MKILKYFILLILILSSQYSFGQFNFRRTYGFSSINEGKSVKLGIDGGFIIAGTTSINNTDIYILKLNDDGSLLWQKTIGSSGIDHANSMTKTYDSCYVFAGFTNGFNGTGDYNIYIVKTDRNGQLLWQKEIGGLDWDFGYCIKQTPDSGFIIIGNTYNGTSGGSDGIFIKVDSTGNFQWEKIFNTPEDDYLYGVDILSDGSMIANGTILNGNGGSRDIIIEKINSTGDSLLFKQYGSDLDEESFSIFSINGRSLIVGSNSDTSGLNNLTLRINDNGDSLSTSILSHLQDEVTFAIDTSNSAYIITGYTSSYGSGGKDLFISRIDSLGNDIQGSTYGGTENEVGNSVLGTPDGGVIAVGFSTTYTPGTQSVYIVKTDDSLAANSNVIIGLSEINNTLKLFSASYNSLTKSILITCDPSYHEIEELNVNIYDTQGKLVFNKSNFTTYSIPVNLENNSSGIYIISITDNNNLNVRLKFLLH